jgi:hypothetical protein
LQLSNVNFTQPWGKRGMSEWSSTMRSVSAGRPLVAGLSGQPAPVEPQRVGVRRGHFHRDGSNLGRVRGA